MLLSSALDKYEKAGELITAAQDKGVSIGEYARITISRSTMNLKKQGLVIAHEINREDLAERFVYRE